MTSNSCSQPLSASNLSNVDCSTSAEIPARRKVAELSLLDAIVRTDGATGEGAPCENGVWWEGIWHEADDIGWLSTNPLVETPQPLISTPQPRISTR